jgi:hypothetical protein
VTNIPAIYRKRMQDIRYHGIGPYTQNVIHTGGRAIWGLFGSAGSNLGKGAADIEVGSFSRGGERIGAGGVETAVLVLSTSGASSAPAVVLPRTVISPMRGFRLRGGMTGRSLGSPGTPYVDLLAPAGIARYTRLIEGRMAALGVPERLRGMLLGSSRGFNPKNAGLGSNLRDAGYPTYEGLEVGAGFFEAWPTPVAHPNTAKAWAAATLRDRADAVIVHELLEFQLGKHSAAVEQAVKTGAGISAETRAILEAMLGERVGF